ncbi:putative HAD-superfamily hydrolase, subfamily IA [Crocosphaera subtropica ATCC 51142]|uniref:HAD-superfamily hydrolase, subfamily IA n=1 Tax=Crocosphaera subtropica (strain ATCC 51142 / BH68) TaxID=43989 RepID=B1WZL9_CROS5|nr:HAD family hydrolase [Crocosphaera subtropica]ACB51171.1 putative HAD-superfamily hydrolase, subfamily IA [Crocosphaera subtropica ATCC 51142]
MVNIRCGDIEFNNIEAIIFDKDGTLEDSNNFLRELSIRRARLLDAQIPGIGEPLLMAFGLQDNQLDPTGLMAVGSRQENLIAAAAYIAETGRSWFEALEMADNAFREVDKYLKKDQTTSPLFTGSLEVLKTLFEAGLKLAILSAAPTQDVEHFVEEHNLSNYIQVMMGGDQGLSKPDPKLLIKACEMLKTPPNKTLMVGDSQGDITMAKQAGVAGTIGICWANEIAGHLDQADMIITQIDVIQPLKP